MSIFAKHVQHAVNCTFSEKNVFEQKFCRISCQTFALYSIDVIVIRLRKETIFIINCFILHS